MAAEIRAEPELAAAEPTVTLRQALDDDARDMWCF
jgi:hypothetical protein